MSCYGRKLKRKKTSGQPRQRGTKTPFSPCFCPKQEAPEGAERVHAAAANSSSCKSSTGRDFKTHNLNISRGSPKRAERQQRACRKGETKPCPYIWLPHRLKPLGTEESVEQELSSWPSPLRFPKCPSGPQLPGTRRSQAAAARPATCSCSKPTQAGVNPLEGAEAGKP